MPVRQLFAGGAAPRPMGGGVQKFRVPGLLIGFVAVVVATSAGLLIGPADIDRTDALKELLDLLPFVSVDSGLSPIQ